VALTRAMMPAVCSLAIALGHAAFGTAADDGPTKGSLQSICLRCDDQEDPLTADIAGPRLSWICQANDPARRGLRQTAFQVLVASSEALLRQNRGDLWDSGRVASDPSVHIRYAGRPLASRARCFWKVRIWDQDSRPSTFSRPASCRW
jgi:alpha-L-rhamnosidase